MTKNTVLSVAALIVLTACFGGPNPNPQGARVRPLPNYQGGAVQPLPPPPPPGATLNQGVPLQESPEANFIQSQTQQQMAANSSAPSFPGQPTTAAPTAPTVPKQPAANSAPPATYIPPAATTQAPKKAMTPPTTAASNTQQAAAKSSAAIPNSGNAVKTLLDDARKAASEGNLDKAASSLNRAVQLEPRNAAMWYDLSQIRLHQKRYAEAEQLAQKAISFSGNNQTITKQSWNIIAAARAARGDNAGAQQAKQNAQ